METIPVTMWQPLIEIMALHPMLTMIVMIIGFGVLLYSLYLNLYKRNAENNKLDSERRQSESDVINILREQITRIRDNDKVDGETIKSLDRALVSCNMNLLEHLKEIYIKDMEITRLKHILKLNNIKDIEDTEEESNNEQQHD